MNKESIVEYHIKNRNEYDSYDGWVDRLIELAKSLEITSNELKKWKEEALKVMNQWNEVSDYINLNAEVEDLGRFVPQICLKYLKERDEMKKVEEQRDKALLIAHNLKEAIESTFTVSKDSFNADSSYEYIEIHGWTHEILKFAREEIKKLEVS